MELTTNQRKDVQLLEDKLEVQIKKRSRLKKESKKCGNEIITLRRSIRRLKSTKPTRPTKEDKNRDLAKRLAPFREEAYWIHKDSEIHTYLACLTKQKYIKLNSRELQRMVGTMEFHAMTTNMKLGLMIYVYNKRAEGNSYAEIARSLDISVERVRYTSQTLRGVYYWYIQLTKN